MVVETAAAARFRRLYEEHHRAVLAYFLRRTDRDSAYEATEDVFVVAWRKLDAVPDGEMALAWLYTTARNVLANQRRKAARFDRLKHRLIRQLPEPPPEPEPQLIQSEEHRTALACLAGLSPADQEVLRLAVWEELPHARIGELLGCSAQAVDVRVHRALKRLAKAFDRSVHKRVGGQASLRGELR